VKPIVLDTGPLVALLNRRDAFHGWVRDVLDDVEPPVFTCEPVIGEAFFLLRNVREGPDAVLDLVEREIVRIDFHLDAELAPVRTLMKKFASIPMSLADACVVRMTELEPRSLVMTLDDDFRILNLHEQQLDRWLRPSQFV